jgi:transcription initiation factor IIE alpha subunit
MLVYRYGLLAPTHNAALVAEQLRKAHTYRNVLVEIERERRKALAAAMNDSAVVDAEKLVNDRISKLAELRQKLRVMRVHGRSRRTDADELKAQVDEAKRMKNEAIAAHRVARRSAFERIKAERERIEALTLELRKGARAICDVYWGSYLLIEDADVASRKAPLWDGAELHLPRFVRWNGEGQVGVQVQGGMSVEEVTSEEGTLLQILARQTSKKGEPWDAARSPWGKLLRMRVGSTDTGKPIWAEWPMKMHRELPPHAVIKRAAILKRFIGPREEWALTITLDDTLSPPRHPDVKNGKAVAVDFGWRSLGGEAGIRVATWSDQEGHRGELAITRHQLNGLRKANELRSVRDKELEVLKARVNGWRPKLSPELQAETDHVWNWRSPKRFIRLAEFWKLHRFPADEDMFIELLAWCKQDRHLWSWESSQRIGSLRWRKDLYRCFARDMARRYEWLVIKDFNMAEFVARVPEVEHLDTEQQERARSYRHLVSPSELRLCLMHAFTGARVKLIVDRAQRTIVTESSYTTITCHVCGSVEKFDKKTELRHTCNACGTDWDQDDNACENLLKDYELLDIPSGTRESNEAYQGRWHRLKKEREERQAKQA